MNKLSCWQKHVLGLIAKDKNLETGWTKVSKTVYPLVQQIPHNLVEFQDLDDSKWARLTTRGKSVLDAMKII
jgi:hypothetical protein